MALSMWKRIFGKSAKYFQRVEYVQLQKINSLGIRLGLFSTCSQSQSPTLCYRLHSVITPDSKSNRLFLPSCFCQTPLCYISCTATHQKSAESTNSEVETEELDKLYKTVELRVKSHDDAVLSSYEMFVTMAAKELGVQVESVTKPLRKIQRLTLLKSRHIYKKHRVQYEMRTHFRVITLIHLTGTTADVFLEYIEMNLPEGIAMKVTKCAMEKLPVHLQSPPDESIDSSSSSSASSSDDEDDSPKQMRE